MDLSDLKNKSLSEMTIEELHEHLRQIRVSRRTVKDSDKAVRSVERTAKKQSQAINMRRATASMTADEIKALLKEMGVE